MIHRKMIIPLAAGIVLLASCENPATSTEHGETMMAKSVDTAKTPDWSKYNCETPQRLDQLDGLTLNQLKAAFGVAASDENFALGNRMDEFHVSLQNKYPLSRAGNEKTNIRELTWIGPKCKITAWLDKQGNSWRTFDSLIYSVNSEF
jgi:hypothetical protein